MNPSQQVETEQERLDRELDQLLNELRVAMPGVQVLFAFLLAVPFQQRFGAVTEFQKGAALLEGPRNGWILGVVGGLLARCWRVRGREQRGSG